MSSIRTYSHTAPYVYTAPYGDIHSVYSPLHYAARLPYAVTSIHLRTANVYHICAYPIILSRVIRVAKMTSRRWLRSSASYYLEVLPHHLSTVSKRAFPVAGANISHLHSHSWSSDSISRLSSSLVPTRTSWYNLLVINYHCFLFSCISCGPCNNWHYLATLNMLIMMVMMMM